MKPHSHTYNFEEFADMIASDPELGELFYDPEPESLYDPEPLVLGEIPQSWFIAMRRGIAERSDVRYPGLWAWRIWKALSPEEREEIKLISLHGGRF
ncbi:Uncharacterised protein [uncultured archaeon]|nr:Uncharacterised protein [uncultured archaeon]